MSREDEGPQGGMREALRAVLLFHSATPWTPERRTEWLRITGREEATTKTLCDHVRFALQLGVAGDAGEGERLSFMKAGHVMSEQDVIDLNNLLDDHNTALGEVEEFHRGRIDAFFQIGGQALVDKMAAEDKAMFDEAFQRALALMKDMAGRPPKGAE